MIPLDRSLVGSFNLLCVTLVINYGISSASLFAANGPVEPLTADNFVSFIHHSPQVWLVNFYSAWCGHCQRLAPEYLRFASEIQDWKPVIGVAAVHCSDATNAALCRNYDVRGFPTIKVFPPNSSLSEHGQQFESESRYFIPELLRYLMYIVNIGRADASWPQLGSIRHSAELLSGSDDKQVFIIVEDDASIAQNVALMVILDLLPQRSTVVVGRMRLSDARVYGLTDRGLFTVTLFKSLVPIDSNYDRNALVSTIRSRSGANDVQQSEVSTSTASPLTNTDLPHKDNVIPGLHMQDIETCIFYSLWIEVTARTSFNESALNALKAYIKTVAEYLPGENHLMKFLHKTDVWLKHQRAPLGVDTWLNQITNTQSDDAYVSSRLRWTWCEGSRPQYRGYPCSLWMTFHTLTVNAYLQKLNNTSYVPTDVITAIRGYVEHFLGCRECAGNFGRGASRVLDAGTNSSLRYLTQNDGAALWLWLSHNRANQRLHGDVTEDPSHPKIQFPSMEACETCWLDQSKAHWNETAVLAFLVQYYGAPYVIDDDIHDGPGTRFKTSFMTSFMTSLACNTRSYWHVHWWRLCVWLAVGCSAVCYFSAHF